MKFQPAAQTFAQPQLASSHPTPAPAPWELPRRMPPFVPEPEAGELLERVPPKPQYLDEISATTLIFYKPETEEQAREWAHFCKSKGHKIRLVNRNHRANGVLNMEDRNFLDLAPKHRPIEICVPEYLPSRSSALAEANIGFVARLFLAKYGPFPIIFPGHYEARIGRREPWEDGNGIGITNLETLKTEGARPDTRLMRIIIGLDTAHQREINNDLAVAHLFLHTVGADQSEAFAAIAAGCKKPKYVYMPSILGGREGIYSELGITPVSTVEALTGMLELDRRARKRPRLVFDSGSAFFGNGSDRPEGRRGGTVHAACML